MFAKFQCHMTYPPRQKKPQREAGVVSLFAVTHPGTASGRKGSRLAPVGSISAVCKQFMKWCISRKLRLTPSWQLAPHQSRRTKVHTGRSHKFCVQHLTALQAGAVPASLSSLAARLSPALSPNNGDKSQT